MQTITKILMIDGCIGTWTDEFGKKISTPEIVIGVRARLRFDLRQTATDSETGIIKPVDSSDVIADSYFIALDSDYLQETDPKLLKLTNISVIRENGFIYFETEIPNTAVPGLLEALNGGLANIALKGEIGGYQAGNDPSTAEYAIQFPLTIRNRVWLGGEVPPEVQNDPEYLKAHEIYALIENISRPEKGDDGLSAYQLAVEKGYRGTLDEWLEDLKGPTGGQGLSAYQLAVEHGYTGTVTEWLIDLKGEPGENGRSAYQLAVERGYDGTEAEWLESLHGKPGQDLKLDAAGELSERAAYDDRPQGFTFGATETDKENQCSKLYIYIKKSDEYNDWCTPIVITFFGRYGKDGENIALIKPLEFEAPDPEKNTEYFSFSLAEFPAVDISGVYIDTPDGEYRLPYDSARGIQKIIKDEKGTVKIYFGTLCPEFETGRIYFSQGSAGLTQYQWYLKNGGTLSFEEWVNMAGPGGSCGDDCGGGGFKIDATGPYSKRIEHAAAEKGFTYATTDIYTDSDGKKYSLLYVKRTSALNDWYPDPIRLYMVNGKDGKDGIDGENALAIEPKRFIIESGVIADDDKTEYLRISNNCLIVPNPNPAVFIGSVTIDTEYGELVLPYYSDEGVTRIIRNSDSEYLVFFGGNVPEFTTGTVYYGQGLSGATQYQEYVNNGGTLPFEEWVNPLKNAIPDAPKNDRFYARCNERWVDITDYFGGGEPPDPPGDELMYYGYVPAEVADGVYRVTEVTKSMLESPASHITMTAPAELNKVSLGVVPAYALVVVLIPAKANMVAAKFNGLNGKAPFAENNGANGTGANGTRITIDGVAYDIYGEFKLTNAELFIYVDQK